MFWKPTLAIQGDVGTFIMDLVDGLHGYKCDPEWLKLLMDRDKQTVETNR